MVAVTNRTVLAKRLALGVMIWVIIIGFGVIYAVHTNLQNTGVVVQTTDLGMEQIPSEIRPYLRFQGKPVILLLKQPIPVGLQISESEQYFVVITGHSYPVGDTVEVVKPTLDWQVDYRDFPFGLRFNRLLISDIVRDVPAFEASVERMLYPPWGSAIWYAALLGSFGGPLLLVIESFVFDKRPTLASLLLTASAYSLLVFFQVAFAGEHYNYLSSSFKYLGYIFPALFISAFLMWRFERSPSGVRLRQKIWGL